MIPLFLMLWLQESQINIIQLVIPAHLWIIIVIVIVAIINIVVNNITSSNSLS